MHQFQKSILAIDDVTLNLLIVKDALSKYVNVYIAKSGKSAFHTLKEVDIDLFLLDLQMPEMDGFEFLERLRTISKYKDTPVIIISSKDKEDTIMRAINSGVTDYIVKPFKKDLLCEKVLNALNLKR